MHTLLIVDDEPVITDSLYELFLDSDLDLDIYTAYSGKDAIDLMDRVAADILLTDIRMPRVSGIDLLHRISATWPLCKVIFLTGHSEFEYAQAAIRGGTVDYVLKSEDDDVLIGSVRNAISKLDDEIKSKELVARTQEHYAEAAHLLRSRYVGRILGGERPDSGSFRALGVDLDPGRKVLLVVGRQWEADSISADKAESVEPIVEEYLSPLFRLVISPYAPGSWVWIVQPKVSPEGQEWVRYLNYLRKALEKAQQSCIDLAGLTLSFIVTTAECDWKDSGRSFERLKQLLKRSHVIQGRAVITDTFAEQFLLPDNDAVSYRLRSLLNTTPAIDALIDEGRETQLCEWIDTVINVLEENTDYTIFVETYYSIALPFLKYINDMRFEDDFPPEYRGDHLMDIEARGSLGDVRGYLHGLVRTLIDRSRAIKGDQTSRLIDHLHRYIAGHLEGDLSLTRLAETVNLNGSYLSRLYKSATGDTLTQRINSLRIDRACHLLRETRMQIHDVGRHVGYKIPAHFTRFFKRMIEQTPVEYRRDHGA